MNIDWSKPNGCSQNIHKPHPCYWVNAPFFEWIDWRRERVAGGDFPEKRERET